MYIRDVDLALSLLTSQSVEMILQSSSCKSQQFDLKHLVPVFQTDFIEPQLPEFVLQNLGLISDALHIDL